MSDTPAPDRGAEPGAWIETLRWPEVGARLAAGDTVIVPVGARAKEHGHHLPMQTDYLYARALCDGIAARLPVLVAPVVDFGYYPAFEHYPGSQHLRAETFIALIEDILAGFIRQGARRIAIVNTGVSTKPPIYVAVRNTYARHGARVAVADIEALGRRDRPPESQKLGGHADEMETSVILAVAPDLVDMSLARPDYGHALDQPRTVFYRPTIFSSDPASGADYSATGVRGDPTFATAEKGRALLDVMIAELVDGLIALDRQP